jgi:hypothetical protein
MHPTRELIDSLAVHAALDSETLAHVVDALYSCEEAVTACAAGMLAEQDIDRMRSSVLRDLDCSDVVATTRRLLTRATADDSTLITAQLEACLIACRRSEERCKLTAAEHEHCRLCKDSTHQAAEACRRALKALRSLGRGDTQRKGKTWITPAGRPSPGLPSWRRGPRGRGRRGTGSCRRGSRRWPPPRRRSSRVSE